MTFFNIVIPLYNAEKWLTRCLKTVMAQDYNNYRVIIVDDCSTDNSKSVIESQIEGNEKFTLISAQKTKARFPVGIKVLTKQVLMMRMLLSF